MYDSIADKTWDFVVLVPDTGDTFGIRPRSAVICPREDFEHFRSGTADSLTIDFEGAIYAPNTFEQMLFIAAHRSRDRAPTIARLCIRDRYAFVAVGHFNVDTGWLLVTDQATLDAWRTALA